MKSGEDFRGPESLPFSETRGTEKPLLLPVLGNHHAPGDELAVVYRDDGAGFGVAVKDIDGPDYADVAEAPAAVAASPTVIR
jgi:hypothetical protein